jgi:tRNA threonylcarbamoyladenosine biosynthesis protein TsaB
MNEGIMSEWRLILETSGRIGRVGLARDGRMVHSQLLDDQRRHARDLTLRIEEMLQAESLTVPQLASILVSIGPGSYTGLRVGVTTAKVLAYASGVPLFAIPTFHAIAAQSPVEAERLWVIGDALQGLVYFQRFQRRKPTEELKVAPAEQWLPWANREVWLSGPAVALYRDRLPCDVRVVPEECQTPTLEGILAASDGGSALSREDLFRLEPLYLRGSSAEEKSKREGREGRVE